MKKIAFIAIFLISVLSSFSDDLEIGVRGGMNIANIMGDNKIIFAPPAYGTDASTISTFSFSTLTIGVFANYKIDKNLTFRPEIDFNPKGYNVKPITIPGTSTTITGQTNVKMNYLEIPFHFTYSLKTAETEQNYVYLVAGPYISFLMGASQKGNYTNIIAGTQKDFSIDSNLTSVKNFDYGINIGAGYHSNIFNHNVFAEAKYSRSLPSLSNLSYSDGSTYDVYHETIMINIGITLFGNPVIEKTEE